MSALRSRAFATSATVLVLLVACGGDASPPAPTPVVLRSSPAGDSSQPGGDAPSRIVAVLNGGADSRSVVPYIRLEFWQPNAEVRVEIWDSPARNQLLGGGIVPTNGEGVAEAYGVTLAAGMFIVATDDLTTKQLTIVELLATADAASDVVSGTAPPGSRVTVQWSSDNNSQPNRSETADASGHFSFDFSDPTYGPTRDIVAGSNVGVSIDDGDNDWTYAQLLPLRQ